MLAVCPEDNPATPANEGDDFCDVRTCQGGANDGQSCDGVAVDALGNATRRDALCVAQGGMCMVTVQGVCTNYPLAGAARGNDDYRAHYPGDVFLKGVCPGCGGPRWFDAPGMSVAGAAVDFRFDADFISYVRSLDDDCDCQCHFRVTVDWAADADGNPANGAAPGHRVGGASGITLVQDAETFRCTQL
jgi:hypothetical protein